METNLDQAAGCAGGDLVREGDVELVGAELLREELARDCVAPDLGVRVPASEGERASEVEPARVSLKMRARESERAGEQERARRRDRESARARARVSV